MVSYMNKFKSAEGKWPEIQEQSVFLNDLGYSLESFDENAAK